MSDTLVWELKAHQFGCLLPRNMDAPQHFPAVHFREFINGGLTLRLHRLEDAELVWWRTGVAVFDRDGHEVEHLGFGVGDRPRLRPRGAAAPRVEGAATPVTNWADRENYSHLLCEGLPVWQALEEAGVVDRIEVALCHERAAGLVREAAALYGRDPALIRLGATGSLRFDELYIFEPWAHPAHWAHDTAQRFFDRVSRKLGSASGERRLWIDRPAGRRGFAASAALDRVLSRYGFERVSLDGETSLGKQARLFSSAAAVVGAHGAALTNVVFCGSNAAVIEVFNQAYGTPAFWSLASMRRQRYAALHDRRGLTAFDEATKYDDIEVDAEQLERALRSVGVRPAA